MTTLGQICENARSYLEMRDEAIAYYEWLCEEATSHVPGSIGMQIRVETLETEEVIRMMYQIVAVDQLWENQIDMYGQKLPRYKPDTIRKKAKLPHQTPDKLVNYTEAWSFKFMNYGLRMDIDASRDEFRFAITDAYPYFAYIPEEYIGMTEENFEAFTYEIDKLVYRAQRRYIQEQIDASPYADIINALRYTGYDFSSDI